MNPPKTAPPSMVTPGEAADLLNVSLPHVTKLIVSGQFTGVQRTASGHRRIPLAEVERVAREMRKAKALRFLHRKSGEAPRAGDKRD